MLLLQASLVLSQEPLEVMEQVPLEDSPLEMPRIKKGN